MTNILVFLWGVLWTSSIWIAITTPNDPIRFVAIVFAVPNAILLSVKLLFYILDTIEKENK